MTISRLGLGTAPESPYLLKIYGDVRFHNSMYYGIIVGTGDMYEKAIYPTSNNKCNIGKSNYGFKNIYYDNLIHTSDKRLKENIRDIDNALELVTSLKGVKYDMKKEFLLDEIALSIDGMEEKIEKERKNHYGFLAQDVEEIYPFAVSYDDSTDIYGIDYTKFVPILVEAIKEQEAKIASLETKLTTMSSLDLQEKTISIDETSILNYNSEIQPFLGNNIPNPFDQVTKIEFYLPKEVNEANLYIYDLQGKQIQKIHVVEREYGSIVIQGSQLMPGMYYYSLIANNQVIGTKQMILTD